MDQTAEMRALHRAGMSLRQIGDKFNMTGPGVFYRLGGNRKPLRDGPPLAANDNKFVKMIPHNGGCSTTSGLMPVSLARSADVEEEQVAA
ncbi:hypothetical protein [Rhizobium leucaenae]|uniref:hypothetical protein n=1 Tax=Rhizobium leucaenae TaxID=29450 RepID=UPI00161E5D89|nr:hypothetical protein [Rhizobium leucaenae]MBB6299955.1 hypothetical protein [Rhizobium leucaenae]